MKIARGRSRRTLGGMMALIAAVSLPLACYVYRVREIERARTLAERRTLYAEEHI